MAISTPPQEIRLSPAIRRVLGSLRARIRRYVWLEGATSAVAWLGLAFWLSLALDWSFEPPQVVRAVVLGALGLGLVAVVYRLILRRAFVRFSDANMAMLLERRFPGLDESLLTAVEAASREDKVRQFSMEMLAHTCYEADGRIGTVSVREVFNPLPLRRSVAAAIFLVASVLVFAAVCGEAFGTWVNRVLLFSDDLWPRRTLLSVKGFDQPIKVARGTDVEVIAEVDLNGSTLVPQSVYVRGRTKDGARIRGTMNRVGNAEQGKEEYQQYSYAFQGVLSDIRFDLHGGDCWIEGKEILVVDSPIISKLELDYDFPKYMGLSPRTVEVTGVMQVPQGTKVTVRARANKDLVKVDVASVLDDKARPQTIDFSQSDGEQRQFDLTIPSLEQDTKLLFTLLDTDGIKSREGVPLALAAVPDETPQLEVRLRGIGPAITSQARIPAVGRVVDDHGIARTWWECEIEQPKAKEKPGPANPEAAKADPAKPGSETPAQEDPDQPKSHTVAIETVEGTVAERKLDVAVEAGEFNIRPGQRLALSLKAGDRCDRGTGANVGTSDRWVLDVVTPEELRTMLEYRELVLRQRFEVIIREVEETRDLLARMEFAPSQGGGTSDNTKEAQNKPSDKPGPAAKAKPEAGAEPGDESEAATPRTPEQIRNRALMAAQRASQNATKNRHELLGVADAFDEIREELINNRIDSDELRRRLKDRIADPLRHIGQEDFRRLEQRLNELEATVGDHVEGAHNRLEATKQVDLILVQLRAVLQEMIKLETFNEAVAALRAIIESQGKLSDETKKRHREGLRDLKE